jgi:hypothetical protein
MATESWKCFSVPCGSQKLTSISPWPGSGRDGAAGAPRARADRLGPAPADQRGESQIGGLHTIARVEHRDAGRRRLEDALSLLLETHHVVEAPLQLIDQLGVLDRQRRLVQHVAHQVDVLARERRVSALVAAQRDADTAVSHQEGKA